MKYEPTTAAEVAEHLYEIYDTKFNHNGEKLKTVIQQSNIGFTRKGLNFLGEENPIKDPHFDQGPMILDKTALGMTKKWDTVFSQGEVHAVLIVVTKGEFRRHCRESSVNILLPRHQIVPNANQR